jgi:ABC-type uncharacterized transport system permease subunit
MDRKMERKFGMCVFLGLLIGAVFGSFLGAASQNPLAGMGFGALVGVAIGWFIGAAILEQEKEKRAGK